MLFSNIICNSLYFNAISNVTFIHLANPQISFPLSYKSKPLCLLCPVLRLFRQ